MRFSLSAFAVLNLAMVAVTVPAFAVLRLAVYGG